MQDIFLFEPVSNRKKRNFSEQFISFNRIRRESLPDIKTRLREVRNYSLKYRDRLVENLIATLGRYDDVDVFFAVDAPGAVERIIEISQDSSIAINRSAVISGELVPRLKSEGIEVIESYYDEFKHFENRFQDYRMIPKIEFESLWNSFEEPCSLADFRRQQAEINGYKDFVGLLGINSVSAEDGAIVFLQHMHNIKMIFAQAREIILVVALDKIVRDANEAIFQAKCMAAFGAESLPLTLRYSPSCNRGLNDFPFSRSLKQAEKIHVILLDNGRSRLLDSEYRELSACIGCRACIRVCPASSYFGSDRRLSPREYLHSFLTGMNPTVEHCIQCKNCRTACPLEIDLPGMIREARMESGERPFVDYLLSNADLVENIGSTVPMVSGMIYDNRALRWLGEKVVGVSRKRKIPRMRRINLVKWFYSDEKRKDSKVEGH